MKAPTKLRIGGQTYKVIYPPVLEGRVGDQDSTRTLIRVSQNQSLDGMKTTLLHEAIHAQAEAMDWAAKEPTVLKMEKLFFSLIRDNPNLIKWILHAEELQQTETT